ncbi:putative nuclease HARBI1 [Eurosta solidaginis]|uniref:putative nuclease HARBI1 n=1 Tax=Eurosta solidaginis TaxID=178769 RepID=UPI0035315204
MYSDEELVLLNFLRRRKEKKAKRKYWAHPYIQKNVNCRLFVCAKELSHDDIKFRTFYRMSKATFKDLVMLVGASIQKENTNMRESVPPEERLMVTLRYLATGCTFNALALYFQRGERTIGVIVEETTKAIWNSLKDCYMTLPNEERWKSIAGRFSDLWQLPNCLGAIDGKHVRIQKYPNSGSANFNYKNYHSVILLACCDADGIFTSIEFGFAGRNSDGGVFRISTFGRWLESYNNLPSPKELPHDDSGNKFPYYFVADNAFPLRKNVMRPYPERNIVNKMRIFNYRLSRSRKNIECSFGMMVKKFGVFSTPIRCQKYETIISIIQSACILHNFIRKKDGISYTIFLPDIENQQPVQWNPSTLPEFDNVNIMENSAPQNLRHYLSNYFLLPNVSLPWQWNSCL